MNQTNREERHSKWRQLIESQKQSGLTQTEFCKQHNLTLATFTYYNSALKPKNINTEIKKNKFAPVQVKTAVKLQEFKIILPNGVRCFIPLEMDSLIIKKFIEILRIC